MPGPTVAELDRASWLHPFSSLSEQAARDPLVIREAHGTRVRDAAGREDLDAMAGPWGVKPGFCPREIAGAMGEQAGRLADYHGFAGAGNEPPGQPAAKPPQAAPVPLAGG